MMMTLAMKNVQFVKFDSQQKCVAKDWMEQKAVFAQK
jgi:hypothetical protein